MVKKSKTPFAPVCPECHAEFEGGDNAIFCSRRCQARAYRRKLKSLRWESPCIGNDCLYLSVARQALEDLLRVKRPQIVGTNTYSRHFHHALTATVFAAAAVEHAITGHIWGKLVLLVPDEEREEGLKKAKNLYRMTEKISFLRKNTPLPSDLIDQIHQLMKDRDSILHSPLELVDDYFLDMEDMERINNMGMGLELDQATKALLMHDNPKRLKDLAKQEGKRIITLMGRGLGTDSLDRAFEHVQTAVEAVDKIHAFHFSDHNQQPQL